MKRTGVVLAGLALVLAGCGAGHGSRKAPERSSILHVHIGDDERGADIFRPRGAARPPVVLFIHGLFATDPRAYGAWIRHLVDEGNEVIYPTYQQTFTPPAAYLSNVISGVRAALARAPVERRSLVAVGHSAGGALAADYAAVATRRRLPPPRVVFAVFPGRGLVGMPSRIPQANPAGVPRDTRIAVLAGAGDRIVGTTVAREIVRDDTTVPRSRRTFGLVTNPLVDHHLAPLRTDRTARRMFWAPFDQLVRPFRPEEQRT